MSKEGSTAHTFYYHPFPVGLGLTLYKLKSQVCDIPLYKCIACWSGRKPFLKGFFWVPTKAKWQNILWQIHKELLLTKTPSFTKRYFFACSLWLSWHNLLLAISGTFQSWLSGPKCLQWFIRDLFSPSTNGPTACSLLAVWHPLPNSILSMWGRRRRCWGLMELFNYG